MNKHGSRARLQPRTRQNTNVNVSSECIFHFVQIKFLPDIQIEAGARVKVGGGGGGGGAHERVTPNIPAMLNGGLSREPWNGRKRIISEVSL